MDRNKLLRKFERYLQNELEYAINTVRAYKNNAIQYLDWLEDNGIDPKEITLEETYSFINHRRQLGNTNSTVRGFKAVITHFNHSINTKCNPMLLVQLKKLNRATPTKLLDVEFLETIYRETKSNTLVQKRDKCMLGMIVFLGLQRSDLTNLELEHLDLEEGRVYVAPTNTTNERYINLNPKQIVHLSNYVYDIRPRLLKEFRKQTNRLFFSKGEATNLNGALGRMITRLKTEFSYVKDFKQLKQSRVTIWVKELGQREAQYLGGYKYVSSLERYDTNTLDELENKLEFHHPMEQMGL